MATWLFVGDSITVGLVGSPSRTGFRGPFALGVPTLQFVGPFVDPKGLHHGGIGGSATWQFLSDTGFARFVKAPAGQPTWMETYKPDVVHLMLGTNDIITNRKEPVIDLAGRLFTLAALAKKQHKSRVLVASIVEAGPDWFSAQAAAYNRVLKEHASRVGTEFIDTSSRINRVFRAEGHKKVTSDGTHPNELGYELMAQELLAQYRAPTAKTPSAMAKVAGAAIAAGTVYALVRWLL